MKNHNSPASCLRLEPTAAFDEGAGLSNILLRPNRKPASLLSGVGKCFSVRVWNTRLQTWVRKTWKKMSSICRGLIKWPIFCTQYFQKHYLDRNSTYFDWNISDIYLKGVLYNKSSMVEAIVWRRTGDKPLSEPTRTTRTPAFWGYPQPINDYPYHWVILDPKSKEDKVKVTNLKNSPKFQMFEFWNGHYTRHTFWSCLIRCANMKWIRWVLLKIQSGHDSVHRRTDRQTDGQGDTSIPPFQLRWSGGYNDGHWYDGWQVPHVIFCMMSLKIILLKLSPHLPGANKLTHLPLENCT